MQKDNFRKKQPIYQPIRYISLPICHPYCLCIFILFRMRKVKEVIPSIVVMIGNTKQPTMSRWACYLAAMAVSNSLATLQAFVGMICMIRYMIKIQNHTVVPVKILSILKDSQSKYWLPSENTNDPINFQASRLSSRKQIMLFSVFFMLYPHK